MAVLLLSAFSPGAIGLLCSSLFHLVALAHLPPTERPAARTPPRDEGYRADFTLESRASGRLAEQAQRVQAVPLEDAPGRGGAGAPSGSTLAAEQRLAPSQGIVLFTAPMNVRQDGQLQRIRTASTRATPLPRRTTPNPSYETFLASGKGSRRRREQAPLRRPAFGRSHAAALGSPGSTVPAPRATAASAAADSAAWAGRRPGAQLTAPLGTRTGRGEHAVRRTQVRRTQVRRNRPATGRPPLEQGRAATVARARDARTRDDIDAELRAASMVEAWVDSTRERAAAAEGPGQGGRTGRGRGGADGRRGAEARGNRYARGRADGVDTADPRYLRWFWEQRRRIRAALRFPAARALAMDQGVTILTVRVRADGRFDSPPVLLRSSGFSDFDRAAIAAVEAAGPFSPVPADILGPGRDAFSVRIPVAFSNPMVR